MSWSEAKWVVDQLLQKTGNSPNNMRAFSAFAMSKTSIGLKFLEPEDSYDGAGNLVCAVGGVMIRKSTEGFPASISEGELVINNTNLGGYESVPLEVTGLVAGQTYYFSAFPYSTQGVFNLSSSGKNRAEGVPADGEQAIVSITIDDASGFTSAVVTCVDETDSSATQSVTLTPSKTTHTFTIPIGDRYHIEFGAVADYFKPNDTASKVSVAGETSEYTGAYSYFTSSINVTYPTGSTLTCTCGDVSYTAPTTTGSYQFKVHKAGTWVVRATSGDEVAETSVVITDTGESKSVSLAYFTATIKVTAVAGAEVKATKGEVSFTATADSNGVATVEVNQTGTYTVTATKSGDTSNSASVAVTAATTYTATVKFTIANVPSQGGNLSYTGELQSLTLNNYDSNKMTLGGVTTGTSAGSYTATVTPKAGYQWSDGSTSAKNVTWTIVKVAGSLAINKTSMALNGTTPTGTIDVTRAGDGAISATSSNPDVASVSVSGTRVTVTGKANGTAVITINVAAGTNHLAPESKTCSVNVTNMVKIYGISRTVANSSTAWARTDDAVGKTATASVGTTAGHSDFDDCYPWSGMVRKTLSTGDVMVYIPEFWFERKVTNGVETIRIADRAVSGFTKHPGSGKYVGAYKTSSNNKSVRGAAPTVSQTRATMRTNAKNKGKGWGLIDVAMSSAIQMLYLVEFADNNSQAKIGRGYCDGNSAALNTGSCDSVPNLTGRPAGTDGKVDMVYRGIEGFWGNIWEWMDGLNYNGDTDNYYVCTDPSKYADDTATGYTKVSFTSPTSNNYISKEGMDNALPWAMLPSEATGGSETTFYPDYFYQNSGWRVATRSGHWGAGSKCGVWVLSCDADSSLSSAGIGSRLLYDPS